MVGLTVVRRARSEDAEAFAAVLAQVAEEGLVATEPPVDIAARAAKTRAMIDGAGPEALWVVEHEGRIAGGLGLHPTAVPGVLSLGMMVLPQLRGRGAGRALLDAAIAHARAVGAHKVELEVWPDNARAIALYASAGFEVEGLRRSHYRRRDGQLRSALLMALALSGEAASSRGQESERPLDPVALAAFEPGTVAVLSTGGGAPHAIPVSNWIVTGPRVLLALARRRESLARLRRDPRVAFTVLADGAALTAHATARVLVEQLAASDQVAAVVLEVHAIQDHGQPTFTIQEGVRWRWDDDAAQTRDAAIRAELVALAQESQPAPR